MTPPATPTTDEIGIRPNDQAVTRGAYDADGINLGWPRCPECGDPLEEVCVDETWVYGGGLPAVWVEGSTPERSRWMTPWRCAEHGVVRADAWAADPVGVAEIAARLGVERQTVDKWRTRKILPAPTWTVGGRPAWSWPVVEGWAKESGRLLA